MYVWQCVVMSEANGKKCCDILHKWNEICDHEIMCKTNQQTNLYEESCELAYEWLDRS